MNPAPIFVKLERHKEVMQILDSVKGKLAEAKDALKKINELKAQEDAEISNWEGELSRVEEKLDFMHDAMTREG